MTAPRFSFALLVTLCLAATGCGPLTFTVGSPRHNKLRQTTVIDDEHWFSDRIAIVDVTGMIINGDRPAILQQGENPVGLLHEQLEKAAKDDRVKAVILRLNTPGGTVTASDAMYREVMRFKEKSKKPVVALMMDIATSGGYYTACSADRIVAYPSTVTGSIGVIIQTISLQPALGNIGIQAEAITSGKNKDAGSLLGKMTDEHRAVLRGLVDDFYQNFLAVVRKARPMIPEARFAEVTDGRVLSGRDALDAGLVDELGDLYSAFDRAKQMAGITEADLVVYHRPLHYVGSPYAVAPGPAPQAGGAGGLAGGGAQVNLLQLNFPEGFVEGSAGFYYLWLPGVK